VLIAAIAFWRTTEYFAKHRLAEGKIGKVRMIQVDLNEAIAILDFTVKNDTDRPIVVRSLEPAFDASDGSSVEGHVVAARDIDSVFRNYPEVGQQFNSPLKAQDTLPANASVDRMIAVRFDVPEKVFAGRKGVTLQVDSNAGIVAELKGK